VKIAIIECYNEKKTSSLENKIDAHYRNSKRLSFLLDADLLCCDQDLIFAMKYRSYDIFILAYASHYAPFDNINKLLNLNKKALKIIISNEYNNPLMIRGFYPFYLIKNYVTTINNNNIIDQFFLNLNVLIYSNNKDKTINCKKKYDCLYFGTYRVNRKQYFKKYLQKNVYLSTSKKNMKKFINIKCDPIFINKLSWRKNIETLKLFRYSIYIEDDFTHDNYNCLANRFYECVMCNVVLFFDISCAETLKKSKLIIDDFFIVNSHKQLMHKIKNNNYDNLYNRQKHFIDFCDKEKKTEERKIKNIVDDLYKKAKKIV